MFKNPDFRGVTPVYLMHVEAKEAVTAETNEKALLYVKSNKADTQPVADISQSVTALQATAGLVQRRLDAPPFRHGVRRNRTTTTTSCTRTRFGRLNLIKK